MSIINAYVVHKEKKSSIPILEFRRELAQGLLTFAKDCGPGGAPSREQLTTAHLHLSGSATLGPTGLSSLGRKAGVRCAPGKGWSHAHYQSAVIAGFIFAAMQQKKLLS